MKRKHLILLCKIIVLVFVFAGCNYYGLNNDYNRGNNTDQSKTTLEEGGIMKDVELKKINNNYVAVENAMCIVDGDTKYNDKDVLKINPTSNEVIIYYFSDEYDDLKVNTLMSVNCRMKIQGNTNHYSKNIKVKNDGGKIVDYGYPEEVWNKINVDGKVQIVNNKKCICFSILDGNNETIYLSDFISDNNTFVLDNAFGGVKLIQWQYPKALMQCYIIVSPDNNVIIIDGGVEFNEVIENEAVEAFYLYLKDNNYTNVKSWFLTHAHWDHYSALVRILADSKKYISIENLYYDFPSKSLSEQYGFRYDLMSQLLSNINNINCDLTKKVENVITPKKKDVYKIDDDMTIKVLNNAYFGSENNRLNDSSVVYKLETSCASVGFLGDLSELFEENQYLYDEISTCEFIQMGHHGQQGCNEEFYKKCKAMKVCLYPGPSWVFDARDNITDDFSTNTLKTMETRNWVREIGIKYSFGGDSIFEIK